MGEWRVVSRASFPCRCAALRWRICRKCSIRKSIQWSKRWLRAWSRVCFIRSPAVMSAKGWLLCRLTALRVRHDTFCIVRFCVDGKALPLTLGLRFDPALPSFHSSSSRSNTCQIPFPSIDSNDPPHRRYRDRLASPHGGFLWFWCSDLPCSSRCCFAIACCLPRNCVW